jgi:hypothetical protein
MGYDSTCSATIDGERFHGTARLEHKDLVFRGTSRLAIPLTQIDDVEASGGRLIVTFGARRAVFDIGPDAEKWANRIAHPPSRADKLGIKPGLRVAMIDIDDRGFAEELRLRQVTIETSGRASGLDLVFFGVRRADDLERLRALASRIAPDGAIWIVRAKGKAAPVTEAASMAAGKRAGLVDVKVASFSDTHSAEKYVIPVAKRARPVRPSSAAPRTRGSASSRGRT